MTGAGISVSADGGETWSNPLGSRPSTVFCPNMNENIKWNSQPFKKDGVTVVIKNSVTYNWGEENFAAIGISIDPDNPQEVYIGTCSGIAVTKDAGTTWQFIDPPMDHVNVVNLSLIHI